jgi:hypothetical protein
VGTSGEHDDQSKALGDPMTTKSDEARKLAQAWTECERDIYLGQPESPKSDEQRATLFNLYGDPELVWLVIMEIVNLIKNNETITRDEALLGHLIGLLGAGHLENLFQDHASLFIDRIEAAAKADPLFARMVKAMWQGEVPDTIWRRIEAIAAE